MKQVVVVMVVMVGAAMAHLALMDPPARNVLWRSGWRHLPEHPDDDYLICSEEAGRPCPPCGDTPDAPAPLPHQAGGKWALGILARNYSEGETVTMAVSVTNSHGGPLEFKLCPHDDVNTPVTQACLDRYPLTVVSPAGGAAVTADYQSTQEISVRVRLPAGVTCRQCVVQMTNRAEQFKPSKVMFRNCADVSIGAARHAAQASQQTLARRPSGAFRGTNDFNDASDFSQSYSNSNRQIAFPQKAAGHKSASKNYASERPGQNYASAQSYEDDGYAYDQDVIYQPWLYEDQLPKKSKSVTRRQRQSIKPKIKKHKQTQAINFPAQSGTKELAISKETLAQLSGANKEKLFRGAAKDSKGYSGFVQPKYDSVYRSRSKSMFPVHTSSQGLGFAGTFTK